VANIDRNSPIPIYHQLKTLIQGKISDGAWQPGDRIPTEQRLCQLYDISRSPVRQALSELAREGMLVRRPGLGTFVGPQVRAGPSRGATIQMMGSDPDWVRVLEEVSNTWNTAAGHEKVSFDVNVVDHNQFYQQLSSAVGGGTAPDAAMVDSVWVAGLAQSGFLYPLDGEYQDLDNQWDPTEFVQDLYPSFIEANSFNGRLYGLPFKADVSLLWYRRDWFDQEHLQPPRDWDELITVATHFLQPDVRQRYGLSRPLAFPGGVAGGEATVYSLMPFIWSAGGEILNGEDVALDGDGPRRALQFLRELAGVSQVCPRDVVTYRSDTSPWLFATGQVAMALGGSYESDLIRKTSGWGEEEFLQRVGCAPPPPSPGGVSVSTVGGISYVILRQCRRPALVMDLLRFAVRPEVAGSLYRSLLQHSPYPSFNVYLHPEADSLLAQVSNMITLGRARPSIPEYFGVSRQLQTMFEAAISGSTPIDEIVQRAADFISVVHRSPVLAFVDSSGGA